MNWSLVTDIWTSAVRSPRRASGRWVRLASQISENAHRLESQSDAAIRKAATELRFRAYEGESLESLLPTAYSLVVESARRHIGLRHFQTQILGGIALHHGCIAEIQTGEGKTLTATLPLFLNALRGEPVHLATANDYLAERDARWMQPVFEALGLTVGAVTGALSPAQRQVAYACDITYGTAREFGFDFLRDRLSAASSGSGAGPLFSDSLGQQTASPSTNRQIATVQRLPLGFALIDEADSLLIDEARTPLIISTQSSDQAQMESLLTWASRVAPEFAQKQLVETGTEAHERFITEAGLRHLRAVPKPEGINSVPLSEIADAVVQSVYVAEAFKRDEHYVVRDGEVVIIDEYTGRAAEGRKWRNGIHQAVEAREGVPLSPLTQHSARVTVQDFFARYARITGMTGTAASAAREFWIAYRLPVIQIPTYRTVRREVWPARVFASGAARWEAVTQEVVEMRNLGRPVLIGTRTIDQSERLSELLQSARIEHQVLNARNPALEAEIVADAGQPRRVTVATNMAGRGTDIKLSAETESCGGLHVICSEPYPSARIDRQLAGRCGRQGDPGSVRHCMSYDDEILVAAYGKQRTEELKAAHAGHGQLDSQAPQFARAQMAVERQHVEERQLVVTQSRLQMRQLEQLGQDPFLDSL